MSEPKGLLPDSGGADQRRHGGAGRGHRPGSGTGRRDRRDHRPGAVSRVKRWPPSSPRAGLRRCSCRPTWPDVAEARACAAAVIAAFGRVDSLVNAAGLTARGTVLDTTPELFRRAHRREPQGPVLPHAGRGRRLVARKAPGTIVNIMSTSAHAGQPYLAPYVAAKAGLAGLTRNGRARRTAGTGSGSTA